MACQACKKETKTLSLKNLNVTQKRQEKYRKDRKTERLFLLWIDLRWLLSIPFHVGISAWHPSQILFLLYTTQWPSLLNLAGSFYPGWNSSQSFHGLLCRRPYAEVHKHTSLSHTIRFPATFFSSFTKINSFCSLRGMLNSTATSYGTWNTHERQQTTGEEMKPSFAAFLISS